MFTIEKHVEIDAGHRVPFHESKCSRVHGHRYRVVARFAAKRTVEYDTRRDTWPSDAAMVLDFGFIKEVLMEEVHDPYDHRLILWDMDELGRDNPFHESIVCIPVIPTAEALAEFWFWRVWDNVRRRAAADPQLNRKWALLGLTLERVTVHETPTCHASYDPLNRVRLPWRFLPEYNEAAHDQRAEEKPQTDTEDDTTDPE